MSFAGLVMEAKQFARDEAGGDALGRLVVMVELLRTSRVLEAVREFLPFRYTSNHAMAPEHTLLAFWLGVSAGAPLFSSADAAL